MIIGNFPIDKLRKMETPVYYYDLNLLRRTLDVIKKAVPEDQIRVHYAVKACNAPEILKEIRKQGFGATCASGGELEAALEAGIKPEKIILSGMAKTDHDIVMALKKEIFCFNVESIQELEVINHLAGQKKKKARVCLRVNPHVESQSLDRISTAMSDSRFGIRMSELDTAMRQCVSMANVEFLGLDFHIGSQILTMEPFEQLCERINRLVESVEQIAYTDEHLCTTHVVVRHINVGGGLGVNYEDPNGSPIPDFDSYFEVFRRHLHLREDQTLHFEPGRAMVAQCGSLLTRVLYVKSGGEKTYVMLDAGMTDLIRPAMYGSYHHIENLSNPSGEDKIYDIVGPICEPSDVFQSGYAMSKTTRGDLLAIRSAGAYGEVKASAYTLRALPKHVTSDELGHNWLF